MGPDFRKLPNGTEHLLSTVSAAKLHNMLAASVLFL